MKLKVSFWVALAVSVALWGAFFYAVWQVWRGVTLLNP